MVIRASNGKEYDLEKLTDADKNVLILLGHLKADTPLAVNEDNNSILDESDAPVTDVKTAKKTTK